jgi:hypothetical protein
MERSTLLVVGGVAVIGILALVVLGKVVNGSGSDETSLIPGADTISEGEGAKDQAAESALRNAAVAAKTFFVENGAYDGWTPTEAQTIEPSIRWAADGPAAPGVVSINVATGTQLVMSTKSASGQALCVAEGPTGEVFGHVDASTAPCA